MDRYAQLKEDGALYYAPKTYILPDGRRIINFDRAIPWLKKYGFKLVKDERPVYNYETHYIEVDKYIEEEDCIRVVYVIKDAPIWEEPLEEETE